MTTLKPCPREDCTATPEQAPHHYHDRADGSVWWGDCDDHCEAVADCTECYSAHIKETPGTVTLKPCPRLNCRATGSEAAHHYHEKGESGEYWRHAPSLRCAVTDAFTECYSAHVDPAVTPVPDLRAIPRDALRKGDVIRVSREFAVDYVSGSWVYDEGGEGFCLDPEEAQAFTFEFLSRPDPDAALIDVMAAAWDVIPQYARARLEVLRAAGLDVTLTERETKS